MDAKLLIKKLNASTFVQTELPFSMQLGLPYLEIKRGELCISFRPHKEEVVNGQFVLFPQIYEVAWVYPFNHIILFRNLLYETEIDIQKPVCSCNSDWLLGIGKYSLNGLYDACSEVLTFCEETGTINEAVLAKYQELYQKTVQRLGMEQLYLKGN